MKKLIQEEKDSGKDKENKGSIQSSNRQADNINQVVLFCKIPGLEPNLWRVKSYKLKQVYLSRLSLDGLAKYQHTVLSFNCTVYRHDNAV